MLHKASPKTQQVSSEETGTASEGRLLDQFMGCAESRQESSSQPLLSSFTSDDDESGSPSMPPRMGQPAQPLTGVVPLSSQHERLMLELLPFKDLRQFHEYVHVHHMNCHQTTHLTPTRPDG